MAPEARFLAPSRVDPATAAVAPTAAPAEMKIGQFSTSKFNLLRMPLTSVCCSSCHICDSCSSSSGNVRRDIDFGRKENHIKISQTVPGSEVSAGETHWSSSKLILRPRQRSKLLKGKRMSLLR
jgi:hypothetical protein